MNYKNNLLTKKKYKIVNQKAGSIAYWTLCIKYTDYFLNRFSESYVEWPISPASFDIKIGKYSWPGGIRGNHYSINDVDGNLIELKMNEEQFIEFLLNDENFINRLKFKDIFGIQPERKYHKNLCILYHIAFFEECIPSEFKDLYIKILEIINIRFNNYKKKMEDNLKGIINWKKNHPTSKISEYEEKLIEFTKPISEGGTGIMEQMQKCAEKIKNPQLNLCKKQNNNYCPVQTDDFRGNKIKPFIYINDPVHKEYVVKNM